jgi:hypothetical protein
MKIKSEIIKYDSMLSIVLIVLVYSIVLIWGFIDYLVPFWGYFGISYDDSLNLVYKIIAIIFSIIPCFFIPLKIERPTVLVYWFLYLLVYIPMIIGVGLDSKFSDYDRVYINFWTLIAFLVLGIFYRLKLINVQLINISRKNFWFFLYPIIALMFLYIIYLYKDSLTFINLSKSDDVYSFRESGNKIQEKAFMSGYIVMWLSNAFFPFLIAVGFVNKDKLKLILGIIGLVVLYMTMANKQYIFVIFFMYFVYRLFKSKSENKIFILVLAFVLPAIILIYLQSVFKSYEGIEYSLASFFLLRTVYNSSFMSIYYNVFFENHPYTYFSHISGFSSLIKYPFVNPLGLEVGSYIAGFDDLNANANFLITDGLSSIGVMGMPIIALICSFVFYIYDSVASKINFLFSLLLISNTSVLLMNVSLFTVLISGGLLFYIFMLLFSKNIINENDEH